MPEKHVETATVHERGRLTIPADIRDSADIHDGDVVVLTETEDGITLKKLPLEEYTRSEEQD
jgi:AbrB family looped-hinge helix DNA binding protein